VEGREWGQQWEVLDCFWVAVVQEGLAEAGQPAGVLGAFHVSMRD
jgi:hypothetical protein